MVIKLIIYVIFNEYIRLYKLFFDINLCILNCIDMSNECGLVIRKKMYIV